MKYVIATVLLALLQTFAQDIQFDTIPGNLHFYPRDKKGCANVIICGKVTSAGYASIGVATTRNGVVIDSTLFPLVYINTTASFRVQPVIRAELAEYGIRVWLDNTLVKSVDSIVCGDVILVNGQSNSISNSREGEIHEYVRTYLPSPTKWTLGQAGDWAQRVGLRINQNQKIPVAILNGGASTTGIAGHTPPGSGLYNNLRDRARDGGVQKAARMIIWYQGEFDCVSMDNVNVYASNFDKLYKGWMADFPGIEKVYVCQINMWGMDYSSEIREIHRTLQDTYSNLEVIATVGTPNYDSHYTTQGYRTLGERIYGIINRDFYSRNYQPEQSSPNIIKTFYSDANKSQITLSFDQPVLWKDSDGAGHFLKDYFFLDTAHGMVVSGTQNLAEQSIVLNLSGPSVATKIRYLPDYGYYNSGVYIEPVLRNQAGSSAFTFDAIPILLPSVGDTASPLSLHVESSAASVPQFGTLSLLAVAAYSGGTNDTNNMVSFFTRDSFVAVVSNDGKLYANNAGTVKIIASKRGVSDSVTITVLPMTAVLIGMNFKMNPVSHLIGESFAGGLIGTFVNGADTFEKSIDSLASWTYDNESFSYRSGVFTGASAAGNLKLAASYGGISDTLIVNLFAPPSYIKRVNFQPEGELVTRLEGWVIDSTQAYSGVNGFGFLGGAQRSGNLYEGNHLLKTYNYPAWNRDSMVFRMDVPDGKYILRMCSGATPSYPSSVVYNGDTIHYNNVPDREMNNYAYIQHGWSDKALTVSGGTGLILTMRNKMCYVVLVSDDGAPMDLVAGDGNPVVAPGNVVVEYAGDSSAESGKSSVYPNPFNPAVSISFNQPALKGGSYSIYDIKGQLVKTFIIDPVAVNRKIGIIWNGCDIAGAKVAAGIFIGKLTIGGKLCSTNKLVLVK